MVRDKVRIRFRKADDLRWTSHHDLLRCFERMLRRAALPFCSTEGFNPRPRLVFAQPLSLGIVGCQELADLELDGELPCAEVTARLAAVAPPGLTILSVERVAPRATLQPRLAIYRLPLPAERAASLARRAQEVLAAPQCLVQRTRPEARTVDIRPFLTDLCVTPGFVELHLAITPNGGARPDEVLRLLDLGDVLESGAVLERTTLELTPESLAPAPVSTPQVLSPSGMVTEPEASARDFSSLADASGSVTQD